MYSNLRRLASLKLTLVGMSLLAVGSLLIYDNPADVPVWVIVVPLALLALNLSAAIVTNNRINHQPGLLVFHIALLGIVLLAGIGRLTHLDAHVEIPIGQQFSADRLMDSRAGLFHSGDLDQVAFTQGPFTVGYAPGLKRGLTHSRVLIPGIDGQWQEKIVGDDRPLIINGYRFYTTHNKGFSTVLSWIPNHGEPITGTINMPSYPLFEYKQDNRWITPDGSEIKFWLQLTTGLSQDNAWELTDSGSTGVLVVTTDKGRIELNPGESTQLSGGVLRFENLTMWMGYRVFYDPTIQWLFYISIAGVIGLGQYFWRKINLQPWTDEEAEDNGGKERQSVVKEIESIMQKRQA